MDILDKITVDSIIAIFTVPASKGRTIIIERRPTYALSFSRGDGIITYTHRGENTVSDKYHAVILPMGETYKLYNNEGGDFPIINFTTFKPFTDKFLSYEIKNPESYLKDFDRMATLSMLDKNRTKVMSIFYDMISSLARENEKHDPVISGAMEYIMLNLSDPNLSNASIAKRAHVSEIYFRKLFKENYGTTPKQYILNMRISRAKEMLSEGGASVAAISEICGFSSIYHFSRAFRSFTGISATEYAKKHIKQL